MLAEERFALILEQLNEKRTVTVQQLCEALHLGYRTPDIYLEGRGLTKVTTEEMGRLTAEHIHR